MTERARFFRALFSGEEGANISNVKFFLGDKYVTQEEIYKQAADALAQYKLGVAEHQPPDDTGLSRIHIEKFLAQ